MDSHPVFEQLSRKGEIAKNIELPWAREGNTDGQIDRRPLIGMKDPTGFIALGQRNDGLDAYTEEVIDYDEVLDSFDFSLPLLKHCHDLVPFLKDDIAEHGLVGGVD